MFGHRVKFLVAALCASFGLAVLGGTAEAAQTDAYRDMIIRKQYTIKYENITPETRQTNRQRVRVYSGKVFNALLDDTTHLASKGIVVCDGENRYEENYTGEVGRCSLQKGGEMTRFLYAYEKNGEKKYAGEGQKGKAQVKSIKYPALYMSKMVPQTFGDDNMSRVLNALLPANAKPAGSPSYSRVAEGKLPNGLSYVDFKSNNTDTDKFLEAIRYYFKGNQMIKIATGQYFLNNEGKIDGVRYIIKIEEFSAKPAKEYFTLPKELEDKTKRDNDGNIKDNDED